ncbi:hypothetical protein N7449_011248 [Penicillium cf. viridicatum]|uniref:FAD-binding domain-containing protein n=1 Tax=Penicillium cf. viridicatum TaxID=2972119 RepID=A0A9W9IYN5_9EURO|nr:hypothetical protein N7449_011248 [Penicillium cf. viridicatum]
MGECLVRAILAAGDQVIATARARNSDALDCIAPLKEAGAAVMELDVTASAEVLNAKAKEAWAIYEKIDVLVNNAAYIDAGVFEEIDEAFLTQAIRSNAIGPLNLTRAFLSYMRDRRTGTILFMLSVGAYYGAPGASAYAGSKGLLEGLVPNLSLEIEPFGLRTYMVTPSYFRTSVMTPGNILYRAPNPLPEYVETNLLIKAGCDAADGNQPGDPLEAGALIVDAVFDKRDKLSPKGSGLMIRPGASRILQSWGLGDAIEQVADTCLPFSIRDLKTGKDKIRALPASLTRYPDWGIHRPILQDIFYQHAIKAGAEIIFSTIVEDFSDEPDKRPSLQFRGGKTTFGDLILIADGIRSRLRPKALFDISTGWSVDPKVSDSIFYGVTVPQRELESDNDAVLLLQQVEPCVWAGNERFVVGRKPRKSEFWSGLFGLNHDDGEASMWNEDGDIVFLRQRFEGICPPLSAVLKLATKCDRWKIAEMPNIPRWTSKFGRAILLGDAAHAMQPNAAQGLSQIIEDIGVLRTLISSSPHLDISLISRSWENIRKPRVERIKSYASWNTQMFLGNKHRAASHPKYPDADWDSIKDIEPNSAADFTSPAFFKWAHEYDAIEQTHKYLKHCKASPKL